MSFFEDVWNYLYESYFSLGEGYTNLGSDSNPLITVGAVIFGLYIGVFIACIAMFYNRRIVGSAVRRMLEEKILTRESALTLSELGYEKDFWTRTLFRDSKALHRVVKCVEEENFYAEQNRCKVEYEERREAGERLPRFREEIYRIDVENDHFYVPEELEIEALTKFKRKGSSWISLVVCLVAMTVVFFAILLLLPWFLTLLNNAFGNISGG